MSASEPSLPTDPSFLEESPATLEDAALARLERVLRMVRMLQSGQCYTSVELSELFSVGQRTIFRDIKLLRDCGIPVDSGPRGRGYQVESNLFWRPVHPTVREFAVLILGVHLARDLLTPGLEKLLDGALEKLLGATEESTRERLENFDRMFEIADVDSIGALPDVKWMPRLLEYLSLNMAVRLWIPSNDPKQLSSCVHVTPTRVRIADGTWWLIGLDETGATLAPIDLQKVAILEPVRAVRQKREGA